MGSGDMKNSALSLTLLHSAGHLFTLKSKESFLKGSLKQDEISYESSPRGTINRLRVCLSTGVGFVAADTSL